MRITLNHCLLLSLALHGALLALNRPPPLLGAGTRTLTVALVGGERHMPFADGSAPTGADTVTGHIPAAAATQMHTRATRQHPPVRNTTFVEPKPRAAIAPSIASVPTHPSVRPRLETSSNLALTSGENATAQAAAEGDRSKTAAWLQTRLLDTFASYFDYPMLARRHGWEGQVKLALRIEPDGHISHLQLAQSSGYAGLDEAALASARRIERLNDVATRLQGSYLDMVLPVEYRLLGG